MLSPEKNATRLKSAHHSYVNKTYINTQINKLKDKAMLINNADQLIIS